MRSEFVALALVFAGLSNSPALASDCMAAAQETARPGAELAGTKPNQQGDSIPGWFAEPRDGDFDIGIDIKEEHSGTKSAFLKSAVSKPKDFGNLTNWFVANEYRGKRVKMSAWVKTQLTSGSAQLWVRVDGDWESTKAGCFDNMDDHPIRGDSDWTQYSLVVEVPEKSTDIVFGLMLIGTGQTWLDDVTFETVGTHVPLTGAYATATASEKRKKPINLNFEENTLLR